MKQCSNCKHWRGDDSNYTADCGLNILTRPPFHAVCASHEARNDTVGAVVASIAMQSATRGNTLTVEHCPRCRSVVRIVLDCRYCDTCGNAWKGAWV